MDDQAETVLMRLARTASIESIAGIPAEGQWKGVRLFRPLLAERRDDLRDLLRRENQDWIDDPSNDDRRFERVRLRQFMPELVDVGIGQERLAGLAARCAAVSTELDRRAALWISDQVEGHPGFVLFDPATFNGLPEELRLRILSRLVRTYGGGRRVERQELRRLMTNMIRVGPARTLGGAVIAQSKGRFLVAREARRIDPLPVAVPKTGEVLWDGRFIVTAPAGSEIMPLVAVHEGQGTAGFPGLVRKTEPVVRLPGGHLIPVAYRPDAAVRARFVIVNSS
jgi:tRNA(Ile)-lysidine synthase